MIEDLAAETAALRALVDPLADADWRLATPAPGWIIADQVSHLAYFDEAALTSATDPDAFLAELARLAASGAVDADVIAAQYRHLTPAELRDWFGRTRSRLLSIFAELDPATRVPWFGPSMSVASSVTARLMETWAHGQDVLDTMGIARLTTARMRHVADLGIRALRYTYTVNGLPVPRIHVAPSMAVANWRLPALPAAAC